MQVSDLYDELIKKQMEIHHKKTAGLANFSLGTKKMNSFRMKRNSKVVIYQKYNKKRMMEQINLEQR